MRYEIVLDHGGGPGALMESLGEGNKRVRVRRTRCEVESRLEG